MLVDRKYEGKKIGVVHKIKNAPHLARAGTMRVPDLGVIRLEDIQETTPGACQMGDAWSILPVDIEGVLVVHGYEGIATMQTLKAR